MSALAAIAVGLTVGALTLALLAPDAPSSRIAVPGWARGREVRASRAVTLAVLRSTHAALRAGMPLPAALRLALTSSPPRGTAPFRRALRAFELNAPLDESLRAISRDLLDRGVALAVNSLAIASGDDLSTSRAAAIIASVADRLAFDERLQQEVTARMSGLQAQVVLLALIVPGIAMYLLVTVPGLDDTLASPLGRFVLVPVAAILETVGIVASRAIVRGAVP